MSKWFETVNNTGDSTIVVSTRIRLARNLLNFPFPNVMNEEQKKQVIDRVEKALNGAKFAKKVIFTKIDMEEVDDIKANAMAERRIISPEFAKNRNGRALFLSQDESVAILVNEEDHIRIQVLAAGSDLPVCLKIATEIDSYLDSKLNYAFDETLGYLTQCPTNLGTGLRASVMLHLPMMENSKMIDRLNNTISKLGMTIRGSMGEGSYSQGALYQISNQITLGISEQNAIDNLMSIVNQVIKQEEALRKNAYEDNSILTNDKVFRAYGILSQARLISTDELLKLLSLIRLGVSIGLLKIDVSILNTLIFESGAYQLSTNYGEIPSSSKRDELRAELVRDKINIK